MYSLIYLKLIFKSSTKNLFYFYETKATGQRCKRCIYQKYFHLLGTYAPLLMKLNNKV